MEECLKSEPAVDPLGVTDASLPEPRLLKWTLDSEIEAAVQQAQERGLFLFRKLNFGDSPKGYRRY